ncbi:angiotensin-converting enzyme-like [Glandiceps talaboti]
MRIIAFVVPLLLAVCVTVKAQITCEEPVGSITDEAVAIDYLDNNYNPEAQLVLSDYVTASWDFQTNITQENQQNMLVEAAKYGDFSKQSRECALVFDRTDFSFDTDRRLGNLIYVGTSALEEDKFNEYNKLVSDMETIYSTGTVCNRPGDPDPENTCYPLDPDLYEIMATSQDYNELIWAWEGWRDTCGPEMKPMYPRYVELANEAAVINDQPDMGAFWRSWYEMEDFEAEMYRLWDQIKPLYQELHAFVRRRLSEVYGEKYVSLTGALPAHILGNMWAQDWMSLGEMVMPYPEKPIVDVTDELIRQNYTVDDMFWLSEDFFVSLGLIPSPQTFWDDSMFVKPDDRDVTCHASAWDFYNQVDFRVKMCTSINHDDLITIHHEMGHTQYFFQYAPLPVEYRDGANPGFHEAIGDVISLSVQTPQHLHDVGLIPDLVSDPEADLNFLMTMALQKLAFLPFGFLIDVWRWEIFDGRVTEYNYNERWWELRTEIQGMVEPVRRSDLNLDFDPGAKFHIPADVPYIRYFVSHILQFQFHASLCMEAGIYPDTPLHHCDIYNSHIAGDILTDLLEAGASVHWQDTLEAAIGTRDMDAQPLVEYFKPLMEYLVGENTKNGDIPGWDPNWRPPQEGWTPPA